MKQLCLDWVAEHRRTKDELDVTRSLDGRRHFGSNPKAKRSTTHAIKETNPSAGRVTTVPWAINMARNMQTQKFWREADETVLKRNLLAAWGHCPKGHPASKTYTPRTLLQRRQAAVQKIQNTQAGRNRSDPNFSSDEPLATVMHNSTLDFPKQPNDVLEVDQQTRRRSRRRARAASSVMMRGQDEDEEAQGSLLVGKKLQRKYKGNSGLGNGPTLLRPHSAAMERDESLFGTLGPLIDMSTPPPGLRDVKKDSTRHKQLQAAKASWRQAERLLSINGNAHEVQKAFTDAKALFSKIGEVTPRDQENTHFAKATVCTRFS